jgi:hypothetical protein
MTKAGKKQGSPIRERLRGLIDANGGGEHSTRVGKRMVPLLGFSLAAWRSGDGPVTEDERRCDLVLKKETDLEIDPYTIVELEVADDDDEKCRLPPDPVLDRYKKPTTWLTRVVAIGVSDPELERIRDAMQAPVRSTHPTLGEFEYDRSLRAFSGAVDWNGRRVPLSLGCPDPKRPKRVLKHAESLLANWQDWQHRAPAFAADRLLALKNGEWADEDDDGKRAPPITRDEFLARLSPNSIEIQESGRLTFWFDDGDLFSGHLVHVDGKVDGKITKAGIGG